MALRELRRGRRKFIFLLLCIAVGVSALVAVKSLNANMQNALLREARTLIAADLKLRLRAPARPDQQLVFERLAEQGIQSVSITETVSMAVNPTTGGSVLAEIKAISPGYPLYGTLQIEPPGTLTDEAAWVSADLLDQFGLQVGDSIKVGAALYHVAGVVVKEPDRITAGLGVAPRVMITQGGMQRAELIQVGSLANHIFLLRLASDEQANPVRAQLRRAFRGQSVSITDFRDAQPQVRRILDRMTSFLSLLSMVALLVGGLGVANATRVFIQEKLDAIAIMKCVGASNRRVMGVYLLQVILLSVTGSALGIALGYGLQRALPGMIGSLLNLTLESTLPPYVALQGLAVGSITSVLFALLPLTAIAGIKPALIFRREMAEQRPRPGIRFRLLQGLLVLAIGGGMAVLSAWVSGSYTWGFTFMGGLAGAVLLLGLASALAVRAVRRIRLPRSWVTARQGLGNLHRPGSQAGAIVLALGVGVSMVLSIYLVQRSLLREVEAVSPRGAPNMIFSNIQHTDVEAFHELVRGTPGVTAAPEPLAQARGRLLRADGRSRAEIQLPPGSGRWFDQTSLTQARFQPSGTELVAGRWWTSADSAGGALVSVRASTAQQLSLRVGSTVEIDAAGVAIKAQVFNLRTETEDDRGIGSGGEFILSWGALDPVAPVYLGQARVTPDAAGTLQRAVVARFPSVTVINVTQILENVRPVLERISLIIRFIAGFSVAAGLIILASSVAATRFRRTRESALYKMLGATRPQVWRIFAVEYAALGLVAAAMGAGLSVIAAWTVITRVMDLTFRWDGLPLALAIPVTIVLTVLVGVVSTLSVLRAKPLQVLRDE